jgi:sterol desaturase/sphingolipid hydroxylase (fatty acid hydroxylase superfamily)
LRTDTLYLLSQIVLTAALTPFVIVAALLMGDWLSAELGWALWPAELPVVAQVVLATVIREFFDYWAHRAMHQNDWLWRAHATHHAVPRLYWLNNSRAHPVEIAFRFGIVGVLPLAILGVPGMVMALVGVAAVVADTFQHANVAFRLGPLSWIYSIGDLHRWHHSRDRSEADNNFGNVYIFWDSVFGTRFLPDGRQPPRIDRTRWSGCISADLACAVGLAVSVGADRASEPRDGVRAGGRASQAAMHAVGSRRKVPRGVARGAI